MTEDLDEASREDPMGDTEWTIERIHDALGSSSARKLFMAQINKAPMYDLPNVFAKWQGVAERTLATAERIRADHAEVEAGQPLPGDWIDGTHRLPQHRGAA